MHGIGQCLRDRLRGAVVVVQHRPLVGSPVKDCRRQSKLSVKLLCQLVDLLEKVVLCRAVELRDLLGAVRVGDAILGPVKLHLDVLTPLLRLESLFVRADDVRELDDDVQLSRAELVVDRVEQSQLGLETLERSIGLVHDRVERVLHEGDVTLSHEDVLSEAVLLVVRVDHDMAWVPRDDLSNAETPDVVAARHLGVNCGLDWQDSNNALFEEGEHRVLDEGCSRLVDVCRDVQAFIEARRVQLLEPPIFVNLGVSERQGRDVEADLIVDRRDGVPTIVEGVDDSVLTEPVGRRNELSVLRQRGIPLRWIRESIPGVPDPGAEARVSCIERCVH